MRQCIHKNVSILDVSHSASCARSAREHRWHGGNRHPSALGTDREWYVGHIHSRPTRHEWRTPRQHGAQRGSYLWDSKRSGRRHRSKLAHCTRGSARKRFFGNCRSRPVREHRPAARVPRRERGSHIHSADSCRWRNWCQYVHCTCCSHWRGYVGDYSRRDVGNCGRAAGCNKCDHRSGLWHRLGGGRWYGCNHNPHTFCRNWPRCVGGSERCTDGDNRHTPRVCRNISGSCVQHRICPRWRHGPEHTHGPCAPCRQRRDRSVARRTNRNGRPSFGQYQRFYRSWVCHTNGRNWIGCDNQRNNIAVRADHARGGVERRHRPKLAHKSRRPHWCQHICGRVGSAERDGRPAVCISRFIGRPVVLVELGAHRQPNCLQRHKWKRQPHCQRVRQLWYIPPQARRLLNKLVDGRHDKLHRRPNDADRILCFQCQFGQQ